MKKAILMCVTGLLVMAGCAEPQAKDPKLQKPQWVVTDTGRWMVHDTNRPVPPVVTPGDKAGDAPSDAVVLFDGKDLSQWESSKKPGAPAPWNMGEGYFETVKDAGQIRSKQKFGSCQVHIEFATPEKVAGSSQGRGNSGVFLMNRYEVQVLDSYKNRTYADGQCGALYGRAVPLVNVCRGPGQWQSYDIIFHRPIFKGNNVVREATFTVFQNGVLIHDNVALEGATGWINAHAVTSYEPHGDKDSLALQDHGNPVRFRNIWVRELKD